MTEFKHGSVKIANNIIDQLIAESALRVEGVESVIGYKNQKIDSKKKDGIVSVIKGDTMDIAISVILNTDQKIYEIAENIQKTIKEQVKVMLNIDVNNVNVIVKEATVK